MARSGQLMMRLKVFLAVISLSFTLSLGGTNNAAVPSPGTLENLEETNDEAAAWLESLIDNTNVEDTSEQMTENDAEALESEECSNYKILNEGDRGQGAQRVVKCDHYFGVKKAWYRFQGEAGKQMPNQCVPKKKCGTHAPGWLNGSHPSVADGAVSRKVCFHWFSSCCQWSSNIRVRNCSGFFVYELSKPPVCNLRYCGDGGQALTTSRPTPTPFATSSSAPTTSRPTPTSSPTSSSECSSYRFLNESTRAMTYNKSRPVVCESGLSGWYRFGGKAGNQMPESCVDERRCGTHAPGWLNGSHPSVADGVVQRKVCFHWSSRCCRWSTNIEVRNCGGFYVYKLTRPPACSLRYCGNGIPPAPECSNYKRLTALDRAQGYKGPSNKIACDRSLKKDWYRFQGNAGKQMPNGCVPKLHCGTHAPGWLNGSHPSVADGAVSRKVCFHWSSGCCQWSSNIRVRNCGGFYVYELPPTRFCSLRYCGDRGQALTTSRPTPTPTPTSLSECHSYRFLNESTRAVTYNKSSPLICDNSLSGWYRFGGKAGNLMPESCVEERRCGTHAPGWLNGSHPSVADGVVQRKVCFHWSSRCCRWSTNIEVRNCGGFYVYKLTRPPACTLRYCGNGLSAPTTVPTPPPTVRPSPTRANHGFIILCLPAGMLVKIKRNSLPSEADPRLFHLNDPGCGALSVDDENIVMKAPLEGCGTVRRSIEGKASFHNSIIVPSSFGNKRSLLQFPFRCTYNKIGYPGFGRKSEPFYKRDEVMDDGTL